MALVPPIEYESASRAVRIVYDDIRATRNTDQVNNFWKVLANDPAALERTWATVKQVMAPGAMQYPQLLVMLTATQIISFMSGSIHSHVAGARAKGMTPPMFIGERSHRNQFIATNRIANGYRIDVDERFKQAA